MNSINKLPIFLIDFDFFDFIDFIDFDLFDLFFDFFILYIDFGGGNCWLFFAGSQLLPAQLFWLSTFRFQG